MTVEEIQSSVVFKNTAATTTAATDFSPSSSRSSSPSSSSSKHDSEDELENEGHGDDSDSDGSFAGSSSNTDTSAYSAGELARSNSPRGGNVIDTDNSKDEGDESEDGDHFDNTNSLNRFQDLDSRRRLYERSRNRSASTSSVNESSGRGGSSVRSEISCSRQAELKDSPSPQVLLRLQLDLRGGEQSIAGKDLDHTEASKYVELFHDL